MKKIGIALAGGGARGAYQIGVWKALKEHGIDTHISAYSGASVGSLNAVLFAMGDYEKAEKTWLNIHSVDLFSTKRKLFKRLYREKLELLNSGLYRTSKLEQLMDETIDYKKLKGKEVYVATTHIGDDKSTFFDLIKVNYRHYLKADKHTDYNNISEFSDDKIKQTVLASCAIPIAFKPVIINNETYYDGGIFDNIPCEPLIENGCDVIIAVDLFKNNLQRRKLKQIKQKVVVIRPSHGLRGILDFKEKYILRRFELGYKDALLVMDELLEIIKEN